jgi:hypothetical protein
MMILLRRILPSILLLLWGASAQNAAEQALRDMQIGMQGLHQAASDPAMMAQLMADMQVRTPGAGDSPAGRDIFAEGPICASC